MAPNIEFNTNTLTTNGGTPVANNRFTLRAGPRGTLLAVTWLFRCRLYPVCPAALRLPTLLTCASVPQARRSSRTMVRMAGYMCKPVYELGGKACLAARPLPCY
jgi:hypothetical protein